MNLYHLQYVRYAVSIIGLENLLFKWFCTFFIHDINQDIYDRMEHIAQNSKYQKVNKLIAQSNKFLTTTNKLSFEFSGNSETLNIPLICLLVWYIFDKYCVWYCSERIHSDNKFHFHVESCLIIIIIIVIAYYVYIICKVIFATSTQENSNWIFAWT